MQDCQIIAQSTERVSQLILGINVAALIKSANVQLCNHIDSPRELYASFYSVFIEEKIVRAPILPFIVHAHYT